MPPLLCLTLVVLYFCSCTLNNWLCFATVWIDPCYFVFQNWTELAHSMDVDSSSKFIGSLTKFLQSLCNGYVEFQRGVELVGHIYLSIDTGEKVDYILHEKVSKNDENSVTFVSNSFHARPLDKDKDKEKTSSNKDVPTSKTGASARGSKDTSSDEDDDVMIVDKSKGVLGSTNSGTILPRGVKRVASPSSDQRPVQRTRSSTGPSSARQGSGSNPVTSPPRTLVNRQQAGGPSATVTSQDSQQENLNMGDLKLEQITRDELLSLASQVGEGGSGPPPASSVPRSQSQRTGAAAANSSGDRPVWIKQEAADDNGAGDSDAGKLLFVESNVKAPDWNFSKHAYCATITFTTLLYLYHSIMKISN